MTVKLDTCARRRDLTSRECAGLLGALLHGLAGVWPRALVQAAVTRCATAATLREADELQRMLKSASAEEAPIVIVLLSFYAGLVDASLEDPACPHNPGAPRGPGRAAADAFLWWAETTKAWLSFREQPARPEQEKPS